MADAGEMNGCYSFPVYPTSLTCLQVFAELGAKLLENRSCIYSSFSSSHPPPRLASEVFPKKNSLNEWMKKVHESEIANLPNVDS